MTVSVWSFVGMARRVIFTVKGDVFGHWDSEWEFTWDLLREPPSVIPAKGIQILLKVSETFVQWGMNV